VQLRAQAPVQSRPWDRGNRAEPVCLSVTKFAPPLEALARAIVFEVEQPADVEVGEIIVRPTAHG